MSLDVRRAETHAERSAVYGFRYRVYVEELRLDPPQADHGARQLRDDLDEVALNYALCQGDRIVGSLRVILLRAVPDLQPFIEKFHLQTALDQFGSEPICTTSRFMLDPRLRHGRALFRLLEVAYRDALELGIRLNYGDCSPHLLPFYEHLGYRRYTRAFNDTTYGYKLPILMLVGDHERLRQVQSPLARLAATAPDDMQARDWFRRTYPDFLAADSACFIPDGQFFDLLQARIGTDPVHSLSLLAGLEREEADLFLGQASVVAVNDGDRIVREGERDATLYVLLSGVAEVIQSGRPQQPLRVLGAGDTFGEIGFLADVERTASVIMRSPGEALVLSGEFLSRFLSKEPHIAARVLLNLSRMLAARLATQPGH